MKLAHVAVGFVLTAATTAASASCAGHGATSADGSTPTTKIVVDWVVWGTGTPGDSREDGVSQYSVYCRDHAAGWRQVEVPASDKDTTYNQGTPCPAGRILGASGCDQSGEPVNPSDPTAAAEGTLICPQIAQAVTA